MKLTKNNLITGCICLSLILSATAFAKTMKFTDENSFADWYKNEVEYVYNHGFITGYSDGSFMPDKNVSRAELAVIIKRVHQATENALLNALIKNNESIDSSLAEPYRSLITMTKSSGIGQESLENSSELSKQNVNNLPEGYSIYTGDGFGGILQTYYVKWTGATPEGDGTIKDYWFGPYSVNLL